jgi:hypothetical protein
MSHPKKRVETARLIRILSDTTTAPGWAESSQQLATWLVIAMCEEILEARQAAERCSSAALDLPPITFIGAPGLPNAGDICPSCKKPWQVSPDGKGVSHQCDSMENAIAGLPGIERQYIPHWVRHNAPKARPPVEEVADGRSIQELQTRVGTLEAALALAIEWLAGAGNLASALEKLTK